jgi:hypothetical protein
LNFSPVSFVLSGIPGGQLGVYLKTRVPTAHGLPIRKSTHSVLVINQAAHVPYQMILVRIGSVFQLALSGNHTLFHTPIAIRIQAIRT